MPLGKGALHPLLPLPELLRAQALRRRAAAAGGAVKPPTRAADLVADILGTLAEEKRALHAQDMAWRFGVMRNVNEILIHGLLMADGPVRLTRAAERVLLFIMNVKLHLEPCPDTLSSAMIARSIKMSRRTVQAALVELRRLQLIAVQKRGGRRAGKELYGIELADEIWKFKDRQQLRAKAPKRKSYPQAGGSRRKHALIAQKPALYYKDSSGSLLDEKKAVPLQVSPQTPPNGQKVAPPTTPGNLEQVGTARAITERTAAAPAPSPAQTATANKTAYTATTTDTAQGTHTPPRPFQCPVKPARSPQYGPAGPDPPD